MNDKEKDKVIERLRTLASLLTVKQVIEAGPGYVEAAGLNSWCINEGLASGEENLDLWWAKND